MLISLPCRVPQGLLQLLQLLRSLQRTCVWAVLLVLTTLSGVSVVQAEGDGVPTATATHLIQVGPQRAVRTLAEAARLARDGDTVELDAAEYAGDAAIAVWTQDNLTIRAVGVGGRARLVAAGKSAEQKGIWVVRGGAITVEHLDFFGARVDDLNGAGIRFEKGHLTVRDCRFLDNQNGILTGGDAKAELDIENSESGHNGAGDGLSHNLYVGAIARLRVTGSYSHHARGGHLLKSRAVENFIFYNRLTDETGGQASYELEFPNGGTAYVVGNLIEQSAQTQNPHLISFGAEGYRWPRNEIYLSHNTLVDDRPAGGIFLRVSPGAGKVRLVNNLLLGRGVFEPVGDAVVANNPRLSAGDFAAADRQDYRLKKIVRLPGKLADPGTANGVDLRPQREYVHPRQTRALANGASLPGALQTRAP